MRFIPENNIMRWRMAGLGWILIACLIATGCSPTTRQIIPTTRPTLTPTATATNTPTPDANSSPTPSPTLIRAQPTGGPSPTPLFGPTRVSDVSANLTPTRAVNPNAPRIEFFTTDSAAVAPGDPIRLFWSIRGADRAVIYQLSRTGERARLWNVNAAGNLSVSTTARDRGQIDFVLIAGDTTSGIEQTLAVPLACPIIWFFAPSPDDCANEEAVETTIIEQDFERGRMIYLSSRDQIYVLFNDGSQPAWISFANRYDPAIHPEFAENFVPPPGFYQPIARLGFLWRGNDTVRNRLGLGITSEVAFIGQFQTATLRGGAESLYISSSGGIVLRLLSGGDQWEIITIG